VEKRKLSSPCWELNTHSAAPSPSLYQLIYRAPLCCSVMSKLPSYSYDWTEPGEEGLCRHWWSRPCMIGELGVHFLAKTDLFSLQSQAWHWVPPSFLSVITRCPFPWNKASRTWWPVISI
jgi:hypothetical protein